MKKTLLYTLCSLALTANGLTAQAQQINGDFSEWENCYPWVSGSNISTSVGTQPAGWHASNVWGANGIGKSDAFISKVDGHAEGHTGVQIQNVYVGMKILNSSIGSWAPGYLSLGTPWNTSKGTNAESKDGGCFGGKSDFSYRPDAVSFNYKFKQNKSKASFIGYLWKGTWTQTNVPSNTTSGGTPNKSEMIDRDVCVLGKYDSSKHKGDTPTTGENAKLIASYEQYVEGSVDAWTPCEILFNYVDQETIPEKINVIFASSDYFNVTGAGEDNGSIGDVRDVLTIDDVRLVYYHSISSCKYNGQNVTFNEKNEAVVNDIYEASKKLTYEKEGVGAIVEESYDETTGKLTITVKGNDYEVNEESVTTYTIQFAKPEDVKSTKDYTEELYVTINGATVGPQSTPVTVQTRYDGKINFLLKNFMLGSGEDVRPVGNIEVLGLERNGDDFSFNGEILITDGDLQLEEDKYWLGSLLGEVPLNLTGKFVDDNHLKVSIGIDMNEAIGQIIDVHLGYTPTIANMTVKANKYGTFYAPFAVTLPGDVKAYTCESLNNGSTLMLTSVDGGEIPANTAVIVESTNGTSQDFYNFEEGLKVEDGNTGLLYGVATGEKTAPAGSYVLQSQEDNVQKFYLVAEGNQSLEIPANRCYLQLPASSGVKAISFPSDPTAVDGVKELLSGKAEIYDLEGRRLPALQKGINIVGGKKVMVK